MADKTTTLKTKTNDNVYPNVIGDNRKNAFVDSSTITHHFYDQTHKVGFQIDNETNIKIQNSLQKPAGLTKTELVGVGTNGQENIEIGDNLTLANGKLSATGGGSGGDAFDVITLSDAYGNNFKGTITGTKPILIKTYDGDNFSLYSQHIYKNKYVIATLDIKNGKIIKKQYYGSNAFDESEYIYYSHFITLTSNTSAFYLTYQNTSNTKLNTLDSLKTALAGKHLLCTGHTDTETAEYISGEGGNIVVGVVDKSDNSTSGITIDSSFTITDDVKPVE